MKHEPDGPVSPNHSCLFWETRTISRLVGRLIVILSLPSQSRHLSPSSVQYNTTLHKTPSAGFISGYGPDLEHETKQKVPEYTGTAMYCADLVCPEFGQRFPQIAQEWVAKFRRALWCYKEMAPLCMNIPENTVQRTFRCGPCQTVWPVHLTAFTVNASLVVND